MGWLTLLKQRFCSHQFAIEDLEMVNRDSDGADRVRWKCSRCWKVFSAHCGLDISPANGPTFRRTHTSTSGGREVSIAYIRKFYSLDFKIGQMVQIKKGASELLGVRVGKLVAAKGQYLTVRGDGWAGNFHPNDIEHVGQSQEDGR